MNPNKPTHESAPNSAEHQAPTFTEKLETLLPGVQFEESMEMREAREVITNALTKIKQSESLPAEVWLEYDKPFEEMINALPSNDTERYAELQIAKLAHKALIFSEAGHEQRFFMDLQEAEDYAYNMGFDEIAEALSAQLNEIINNNTITTAYLHVG